MADAKTGNKKRNGVRIAGGLAALTLGGLLLAPPSGWLVRAQLKSAVGQWSNWDSDLPSTAHERRAESAARIAADPKNQNDLGLQMAAAQLNAATSTLTASGTPYSTGSQRADALAPLASRFQNNPTLLATMLRYMTQEVVHIDDRCSEDFLQNRPPHVVVAVPNKNTNAPANLAAWENYCRLGEQADPNNAYFPLMRAVGRIAAHKNDEGIAALLRASEKGRYEEYMAEETEGQWRLNQQIQGEGGALADMAISAAQLYPQYSQIREFSTFAVAEAVRAEMAGDTEKGFQIRQALTHIGGLMRTDSKAIIGGLVGRTISIQAWSRPGGALPLPKSTSDAEREERPVKLRERYCAYLERIGHGEAAREVIWEANASEAYRDLWQRAENNPNNLFELQPLYRLMAQWAVGVGLLTNLFVLIVLGGLCALVARWNGRVRAGLPLSSATRTGMVTALALPAIGFGVALSWPEPLSLFLILGGVGALGVLVLGGVRRAFSNPAASNEKTGQSANLRNVGAFLGGIGLTVLASGVLFALGQFGPVQMVRMNNALMGLRASENSDVWVALAGMGASSCVSLMLLLGLAIYSRARRIPVTVGVTRGLRRLALPVAAALVLLYAGLTIDTLQKEARASADLRACVRTGEPAYLAGLIHETPPGRYFTKSEATHQKFIVIDSYNGPLSGITGRATSEK